MKTINVTIDGETFEVPIGTTVEGLLCKAKLLDGDKECSYFDNPYIGSLVNHELHSCSKPLMSECTLEPVKLFGDMGKRMYRHTLCYLLCSAVSMLYPDRKLVIGHSLGDGYYFSFDDEYTLESSDIETIANTMHNLVSQNLPIELVTLPYNEALSYFNERQFKQTEALLSTRNDPVIELYRLLGYLDISYEPLLGRTGLLQVWELRPYQEKGMLLRYPRSYDFQQLDTFKDNPLLFSVFKEYKAWGNILDIRSLGQLNTMGNQNTIGSFIRLAEALQQKKIANIADQINNRGNIKFIFIAGPSSSGKTTFAHKLCTQLQVLGKKTIKISLDNYYLDTDLVPKDEEGKPDLEALEAIDVVQFQKTLNDLGSSKPVHLPLFDFKTTTRVYEPDEAIMDKRTLLVIEGIHGMNPKLISNIDKDMVYRIYISALTQLNLDDHNRISTTDNRLIRRIVRDNRTRGTNAEATLSMWPSVQRGENRNIFPYQNNADIMINSALDYELGVLAPFAQPLLKMVKPSQEATYETARRLLRFLDNVNPIASTLVPQDSLLREFIGGSEYNVI
ncbi:nucleoside kinase [uncultured Sphaerochaeta sp.]|uniref:nucleoside kinase n=1 Tax=uncultured Sphaerochaeta sp. TaxID=886478 RepID=UPI002A0A845B|nr:nucleoside kinase [uncultured Sphaerochaeta sp.]